MRKHPPFFP